MVTVGSIIGGGVRLLREHPMAATVWGVIYLAVSLLFFFILRPVMAQQWAAMASGVPAPPSGAFLRDIWLIDLIYFLVAILLYAAAFRAVIAPERDEAAYLRVGGDELRLLGLGIILFLLFAVAMIIAIIGLGLLGALLAKLTGIGAGGTAAIAIPLVLICYAVAIFAGVRLSLAGPLTMLRKRITIGESWRLTRGHFWVLFGAYIVLWLIFIAISLPGFLLNAGPMLAALGHSGFNPEAMMTAAKAQMTAGIGVRMVLGWVLTAIAGGIGIALLGGSMATAMLELLGDRRDVDTGAEAPIP